MQSNRRPNTPTQPAAQPKAKTPTAPAPVVLDAETLKHVAGGTTTHSPKGTW